MGSEGRGRLKNFEGVLRAVRGRFLRDLIRCKSQKDTAHGANKMKPGPGVKPAGRPLAETWYPRADEGGRCESASQVPGMVQRAHECELTESHHSPGTQALPSQSG